MRLRIATAAAMTLVVAALAPNPALALQQFVDLVPNGNTFSCQTCHEGAAGGNPWNAFGRDVLVQGNANPDANPDKQNTGYSGSPTWDTDLCNFDSDSDGYSNGEELGDVSCAWVVGDIPDTPALSNPGDPTSTPDGGGELPIGCNSTAVGHGVAHGVGHGAGAILGQRPPLGLAFVAGLALSVFRRRRLSAAALGVLPG